MAEPRNAHADNCNIWTGRPEGVPVGAVERMNVGPTPPTVTVEDDNDGGGLSVYIDWHAGGDKEFVSYFSFGTGSEESRRWTRKYAERAAREVRSWYMPSSDS